MHQKIIAKYKRQCNTLRQKSSKKLDWETVNEPINLKLFFSEQQTST